LESKTTKCWVLNRIVRMVKGSSMEMTLLPSSPAAMHFFDLSTFFRRGKAMSDCAGSQFAMEGAWSQVVLHGSALEALNSGKGVMREDVVISGSCFLAAKWSNIDAYVTLPL
jgi:hypothetical protein